MRIVLFITAVAMGIMPVFAQTLPVDSDTTLLLHFDGNMNGAQGQTPQTATGVQFVPGLIGQGVNMTSGNQVSYAAANNINALEGTLEFWIKPNWNGSNGQNNFILRWGGTGGMSFGKDGTPYWLMAARIFQNQIGVATPASSWQAGQWKHAAFTWSATTLSLYINGALMAQQAVVGGLPPISAATFQLGGDGANVIDAVIDELRISKRARTTNEIATDYATGLPALGLGSMTVTVPYTDMWVTWWNTPQLSVTGTFGTIGVPGATATWTSSNASVATVDGDGRITATGGGAVRITATIGSLSAFVDLTVKAPVRQPQIETIDPFLSTPASGALYQIPVAIIQFLPTNDGTNIDSSLTGWNSTVDSLRARNKAHLIQTKFGLEAGSRFHGYGNDQASPSLGYRVVQIISVFEDLPPGFATSSPGMFFPDYNQILSRFGGQNWVEEQGVKEIWLYQYQFGRIAPDESNMSSPTTGDISNSYRTRDDLPVFNHTYTLYGYNFTRTAGENIHDHGHQLEAQFGYVNQKQDGNTNLFWHQFVGQNAQSQFITGHSGWTHMPPNTTVDYDYDNMTLVSSDIADWRPDGLGTHQFVNAATWQGIQHAWPYGVPPEQTDPSWYMYWMQNMPGLGNQIPNGAKQMTNWWQFIGDWDAAIKGGLGLYDDPGSYTLAPSSQTFLASGASATIGVVGSGPAWIASSNAVWIHINSTPYGRGPGSVQITIDANSGPARQGTLAIAGQTLSVSQAAVQAGCTYALSAAGQAFPPAGGSGTVTVTTSDGCLWSATSNAGWVTINDPIGIAAGTGIVTYQAAASAVASRTGTLNIAGLSFALEQQAPSISGLGFLGTMPHLAAQENWTSTFTLVNKGLVPATARLSFFGDGNSYSSDPNSSGPLTLPLTFPQQSGTSGLLLAPTFDRTMAVKASLIVTTPVALTSPVLIGSAQLASTSAVDGFVIFHHIPTAQEAVVPMETRKASSYLLAFDNTSGLVLGIALANISAQAVIVQVVIRDDNGVQIASGPLPQLAAGGHYQFGLAAQFPATANLRGTIEFDSPSPGQISVLGLRFTPPNDALTTIPSLAHVGTGGGSIAHLAAGGDGWQTTFVVVNTGTSATSAKLSFFNDQTGLPLPLPLAFPQSGAGTTMTVPSYTAQLAAGATLIIVSSGTPQHLLTGSAQLSTSGNVSGFVIFRHNQQEAVVPLESRNATGYIIAFDNTNGATGIAVNSVSSQQVNVPVIVRDDTGAPIATDTITLAPNGHYAFTLGTDRYPTALTIRGTIEFDTPAGAAIGALGIRTHNGMVLTYTTLPALTR